MNYWNDYNQYQQPVEDPLLRDIYAMHDGTYSFSSCPPPAIGSYYLSAAERPRKQVEPRNDHVINTPDGTQRRPITRVPVEIWEHILRRCIPARDEDDDIPTLSSRKAPMQLTAVTKGLRIIALSLPELWTTISLVPRSSHRLPSGPLLKRYLERSKDRPLTISVSLNRTNAKEDVEYFFWKLAKWSSNRWEHVSVDASAIHGEDGGWKRYVFPRLKSVTIKGDPYPGIVTHKTMPECLIALIKRSDSVKALSWTGSKEAGGQDMTKVLCEASLPMGRLTSLKLSNSMWVGTALGVLGQALMLQELELFIFGDGSPATTAQPIQLLHLRSLIVGARSKHHTGALNSFLPFIFTPNLLSLSLGYNGGARCSSTPLQTFLTQTRCRLTSLSFHKTPLLAGGLHWVLTHFTPLDCLQSLTIEAITGVASPLSQELLAWMMPAQHGLVPSLQTFGFNISALNASAPGVLSNMLKQRCKVRPRYLRKVHFVGVREYERARNRIPDDMINIREFAPRYRLVTSSD